MEDSIRFGEMLAFLLSIAATIIFTTFAFYTNTRFIKNCLYADHWSSGLSAFFKALQIFWHAPFWKERSFLLARRLVEIEILTPKQPRPSLHDFDEIGQYRSAIEMWKTDRKKRAHKIKKTFGHLIKAHADEANEHYQHPSLDKQSDIEFDISKQGLDDCRAAIRRYFEVLIERNHAKGLADDTPTAFLSTVKFVGGYIGPQFLIHGLLSRFKEDWKKVIDSYEGQVRATDTPYALELVEFRATQYSCWLQWGPSISICQCRQWHGDNANFNEILPIAYQYGFGDEDNSIDLVDHTMRAVDRRQDFMKLLNGSDGHVRAGRYELVGKIRWGPNFQEGEFCQAQRAIQGINAARLDGRAVLELKVGYRPKDVVRPVDAGRNSRYFSAYSWAMFVITDLQGKPFFEKGQEHWRNLMPFFEHGNIADANTYLLQKAMLVVKVAEGVKRLLATDPDVAIALVCTSDQSLCNHPDGVLYQPPSPTELVSNMLRAHIAQDPVLTELARLGRFKLPATPMQGDEALLKYSSCHLPDRIEDFFRHIDVPAVA